MDQKFSARGTKLLDQLEQKLNVPETKPGLHERNTILDCWNKKIHPRNTT